MQASGSGTDSHDLRVSCRGMSAGFLLQLPNDPPEQPQPAAEPNRERGHEARPHALAVPAGIPTRRRGSWTRFPLRAPEGDLPRRRAPESSRAERRTSGICPHGSQGHASPPNASRIRPHNSGGDPAEPHSTWRSSRSRRLRSDSFQSVCPGRWRERRALPPSATRGGANAESLGERTRVLRRGPFLPRAASLGPGSLCFCPCV